MAHEHAIPQLCADVRLVEHPDRVVFAMLRFRVLLRRMQASETGRIQRRSRVQSVQRLPGQRLQRVIRPQRHRIGLRRHRRDRQRVIAAIGRIVRRSQHRMRMIVHSPDAGNRACDGGIDPRSRCLLVVPRAADRYRQQAPGRGSCENPRFLHPAPPPKPVSAATEPLSMNSRLPGVRALGFCHPASRRCILVEYFTSGWTHESMVLTSGRCGSGRVHVLHRSDQWEGPGRCRRVDGTIAQSCATGSLCR